MGNMNLNVAIVTGDRTYGQQLRGLLLPHARAPIRIVRDVPDLAFRTLWRSDLVLFGSDLPTRRMRKILRALRILRAPARAIVLMRSWESVDQAVHALRHGAWALVLEDDRERDLPQALEQLRRDRRFLSPRLIVPMLERYRELLGELRETTGSKRSITDLLSR